MLRLFCITMHQLLSKLLGKKGIKSTDQLTPEEAETFDRWNRILSEGEITVGKISEFCQQEINKIESRWDENADASLIPYHVVYRTIIKVIQSPKAERETLEKYLSNLIK